MRSKELSSSVHAGSRIRCCVVFVSTLFLLMADVQNPAVTLRCVVQCARSRLRCIRHLFTDLQACGSVIQNKYVRRRKYALLRDRRNRLAARIRNSTYALPAWPESKDH